MQVVNVKWHEGVFVPLVPVDYADEIEAVVVISAKEAQKGKSKDNENERISEAYHEYKAKFPDDDVDLDDFCYVGIGSEGRSTSFKDELIDSIEGKYNDL
jgi:predicted DNA-binding antitoxin AbrB/MazE fold protein